MLQHYYSLVKRMIIPLLLGLFVLSEAQTQVIFTAGSLTKSENFNTLSNTAGSINNTALPTGWVILETGGGARDNEQYAVDNGNVNTGDTYSYGATSGTDRALGGLQSGSLVPLFGVQFTNNTGSPITSLTITYVGEMWRLGTADASDDRLDFQYSTDATAINNGAWNDENELDFTSLTQTTAGLKDGNNASFRATRTKTINVNIPNGASFWLRWQDFNVTGSDDGLAVDDFEITANVGVASDLIVNGSLLDFGSVNVGASSGSQNYTISGTSLTQDVTVTAPANFQVSKDNSNYSNSVIYAFADVNASAQTVYVKFVPTSGVNGTKSGDITNVSGSLSKTQAVSGNETGNLQIVEDFSACTPASIGNWRSFSVNGAEVWGCTDFGRGPSKGARMNGFSGGSARANEDWLISPAFILSNLTSSQFSFYSQFSFSGPGLALRISTDYTGSGDPNLATWTTLSAGFPTASVPSTSSSLSDWTFSNVNLSTYQGQTVYLAFIYTSNAVTNGAARWTIDDLNITNATLPLSTSVSGLANFGTVQYPNSSAIQNYVLSANNLTADVNVNAPTNFEVSKDGLSFSPSLIFTLAEMANPQTVYVRFTPSASGIGSVAGTITHTSGSANVGVSVSGKEGLVIDKALTLDVVSFNVEWFSITSNGPTNEALQLQNLKTLIQTLDADVYALQEIGNQIYSPNTEGGFTKLLAELAPLGYAGIRSPHPYVPSPSYGNDQTAVQGLAFIYKTSVVNSPAFTVVLDGFVPTSYPTDPAKFWASGRYPYMMSANITINGVTKNIKFINVHAKSGSDADAYTRRIADVQVLKDYLDTNFPNDNIILLGDYNDDVDTSINPGNPSSYQAIVNDVEDYKVVTKTLSDNGLATTYSFPDAIDHVTISNELFNDYVPNSADREVISGFITNPASTLSDHYPVSTRFVFTVCATPEVSITPTTVTSCVQTFTATALNIAGGTVNYDFQVNGISQQSGASNTWNASNLIEGQAVTCVITITGGTCRTSNTATSNSVTVPTVLPTASFTANIACFGLNTQLTNTSTNTLEGSTYEWDINNDGSVEAITADYSFVSTASGTFSVKLTVKNGTCEHSVVNSVTVNALPTFTFVHTSVSCAGGNDGSITFTAEGSSASYQYSIDNGANYVNEATFANLSAGDYTLLVKDANGCVATAQTFSLPTTPDVTAPVITLTGDATINLSCDETYTELGATATDNCSENLTVTVGGDVVSGVGTFNITYNVIDASGNSAEQVTRTVIVSDTQIPVITLNGDATINLSCDETYTELGATATDNCSENLTVTVGGDVVSGIGTFNITYNVSDANGNNAVEVTRTVIVSDTEAPVITLNGNSIIDIEVGSTYTELGASVSDNCAEGLNAVIGGDVVNTSVVGTYVITYNVNDGNGNNATQITRTVNVQDTQAPTAPTLSAGTITTTSIQLNWTGATDNVGVVSYDVYQGLSFVTNTVSSTYTVTGLNPNTAYTFTVKAKDASNNPSNASNELSVSTQPEPITTTQRLEVENGFTKITDIDNDVIVTRGGGAAAGTAWSNGFGVSLPDIGDRIRLNFNAANTGQYIIKVRVRSGNSSNSTLFWPDKYGFTLNNAPITLLGNTATISALSSAFSGSYFGTMESAIINLTAGSQSLDITTLRTAGAIDYIEVISLGGSDNVTPTAPTLSLANKSGITVGLTWSGATDNIGVVSYEVYQGLTLIASPSTTNYLVTGLNPNTTYSFTVKAKDAAGNTSIASNILNVTTTPAIRFEAETNYSVITDADGDVIVTNGGNAGAFSNNLGVRLTDNGDRIRINFNVANAGQYILKMRVRAGISSNPTIFWTGNHYSFNVDGINVTFVGNPNTLSTLSSAFTGSYFGTMETGTFIFNAGSHYVDITTGRSTGAVDYFELIDVNTSLPLTSAPSQNLNIAKASQFNKIVAVKEVYPNPSTSGNFQIALSDEVQSDITCEVLDHTGKLVATRQIKAFNGINLNFDLSEISQKNGIYFLKLSGANLESKTIKVVKN
jgi:trimeric autotransporter adhesin